MIRKIMILPNFNGRNEELIEISKETDVGFLEKIPAVISLIREILLDMKQNKFVLLVEEKFCNKPNSLVACIFDFSDDKKETFHVLLGEEYQKSCESRAIFSITFDYRKDGSLCDSWYLFGDIHWKFQDQLMAIMPKDRQATISN